MRPRRYWPRRLSGFRRRRSPLLDLRPGWRWSARNGNEAIPTLHCGDKKPPGRSRRICRAWAGACRATDRFDRRRDHIARGNETLFPANRRRFSEYGLVAIRRNDWPSALERALAAANGRFPRRCRHQISGFFEARMRLAESDPAAIAGDEPSGAARKTEEDDPRARLMMRFREPRRQRPWLRNSASCSAKFRRRAAGAACGGAESRLRRRGADPRGWESALAGIGEGRAHRIDHPCRPAARKRVLDT